MKIVIVESPSKSKTIEGYLGADFKVLASNGHIRDLATTGKGGLGIDVENGFIPNYIVSPDKKNKVKELLKECKGNDVYLATDPDREGEAISWHLAQILNLDINLTNRVVFNEITKDAVLNAFSNPRQIDVDLVHSQETRRMFDRIIGFKLSNLLQRKIKSKSAGRVQSSVLKVIVDLEDEINAFIPEQYFEINGLLKEKFKIEHVNEKLTKIKYFDRTEGLNVFESLNKDYLVKDIIVKETKSEPRSPLITSTLQQEANTKHGYSPDKTMRIAQGLYEGKDLGDETVGLITYMRTDSTRLSDAFVTQAFSYIEKTYSKQYLGKIKVKKTKNQQDAHEAIRPTSVLKTPNSVKKYLTKEEYNVYKIIYNRAVGSLMAAAIFENTTVVFDNNNYLFKLVGKKIMFDGYKILNDEQENDEYIPNFTIGDKCSEITVSFDELYTKPKPRFTQASLIKEMEDLGIGRPSTYAQTVKTLISRDYIKMEESKIHPTEQGVLTCKKLEEFFLEIIAANYTANMETILDEISNGEKNNIVELEAFYNKFIPLYDEALNKMEKLPDIPTGEFCPVCGDELVIKKGRYGEFTACRNYPECKYIKKDIDIEQEIGILCPICKTGHIVNKVATKGANKGNVFYACNNFPKCRTIFEYKPVEETCDICGSVKMDKDGELICSNKDCGVDHSNDVICPVCKKGTIVEKTATRGKNAGGKFYSCNNFPRCRTLFEHKPINKYCDKCDSIYLEVDGVEVCSNKKCENSN